MKHAAVAMTFALLSLATGCSTTAIMETHPSLAPAGDVNVAKVYFLRPDVGYWGVMGKAFSISLNDKELLTLAKGDYALVYLRPDSARLTVQSWTVINGGAAKTRETRWFGFDAGHVYYVAFSENHSLLQSGTSYVPTLLAGDAVTAAARKTKPVGRAAEEPILEIRATRP